VDRRAARLQLCESDCASAGDGKINSGAELFGAGSGDGFADLAAHDTDGNGWIDESDAVYDQLRVWAPDGPGGGALSSLKEKGVGAISAGHVATPFELRTAEQPVSRRRPIDRAVRRRGRARRVCPADRSQRLLRGPDIS
jgi:hypothetical protein